MKPRVKICGIREREDARFCAEAGADALGFIFYKSSPRYVEPALAAAMIRELPPFITPVGVFVNATRKTIESVIERTGIRAIQLSGEESPADCGGFLVSVVKVFRFGDPGDAERVKEYEISAAMLDGAKDGLYGGSGTMPDLSIAVRIKNYHPLILAGGLNPDNVQDAVRTVGPYAIDVNSGVEASPGKKDRDKVRLLFERLAEMD